MWISSESRSHHAGKSAPDHFTSNRATSLTDRKNTAWDLQGRTKSVYQELSLKTSREGLEKEFQQRLTTLADRQRRVGIWGMYTGKLDLSLLFNYKPERMRKNSYYPDADQKWYNIISNQIYYSILLKRKTLRKEHEDEGINVPSCRQYDLGRHPKKNDLLAES